MIPEKITLGIYQGNTLSVAYQLKDSNDNIITLSGFSGTCEIRKVSGSTLIENPTVTIDADNGIFYLGLTATETAALTPAEDRLHYDVRLVKGTGVYTPIHGDCVIYPRKTTN